MNKISVIIPVYNVACYLNECIQSVVSQYYKDLEIILVDDGSTDGSGAICDTWKAEDSRIVVVHQENKGVSSARNKALNIASGDYIGFVDADDVVEETHFDFLLKSMKMYGVDLVSCFYRYWPENACKGIVPPQKEGEVSRNEAMYQMLLPDGYRSYLFTKLFKKEIVEKQDPVRFDENLRMMEDLKFVVQYMQKVRSVLFSNVAHYKYRVRENSAIHTLPKIETVRAFESIYPFVKMFDKKVCNMFRWSYYTALTDYLWNEKEVNCDCKRTLLSKISNERKYFLANEKYSKKGYLKKFVQEMIIRFRMFGVD